MNTSVRGRLGGGASSWSGDPQLARWAMLDATVRPIRSDGARCGDFGTGSSSACDWLRRQGQARHLAVTPREAL